MTNSPEYRFIKLHEVMDLTALARPTIYSYMKQGKFPSVIKVGTSSYWLYHEVQQWMSEQINHRDQHRITIH